MALDFLNGLSKKLTQVGQEAAAQTKIFTETAKINGIISDEEKQINNLYLQIGKCYFEANKDNAAADYNDLMTGIKDALVRIDKYKEQIRNVKGVRTCSNCGAEVANNAVFCNSCGTQMPAVAPVQPVQTGAICPRCGVETVSGATFCTACGNNLTPPTAPVVAPVTEIPTPVNTAIPTPVNVPEVNTVVEEEIKKGVNINKTDY